MKEQGKILPIQTKKEAEILVENPRRVDLELLNLEEDMDNSESEYVENDSLHSINGKLPLEFVKKIKEIKPISNDERAELLIKIKNGDLAAKNRMIEGNLRLVLKFTLRFNKNGVSREDLFQSGSIGLGKAIENYDPERGCFSTYAFFWIRQEMVTQVVEQGSNIKKNKNNSYKLWRINNFVNDYLTEFGVRPNTNEIENGTKIPSKTIDNLINNDLGKVLSLDESIETLRDEENFCLYKITPSTELVEEIFEDNEKKERILNVLKKLIDKKVPGTSQKFRQREYDIICSHYGLLGDELSLTEIAKEEGVTKQNIDEIRRKGIRKIKKIIEEREDLKDLF